MSDPTLAPRHRRILRAVAETVVAGVRELDDDAWDAGCEIVETALSQRPPGVQRQLGLFMGLVQWMPAFRWMRPFTSLEPERRARFLGALQDAPFLLVRRGFWGLRTLSLMAYYGLPDVRRRIGYRAHPRGWAAERARRGEARGADLEPGPEVQL